MARACIAAVLAALSADAAADWTLVGGIENIFKAYADEATIRRHGSTVDMWGIYDFSRPDLSVDGHKHLSTKVFREFDCRDPKVRLLSFVDYSERMGTGRIVSSGSEARRWEPIVPGAVDEAFWKLACGT